MTFNGSTNSSNNPDTHITAGLTVITCGLICSIGNVSCILLIVFHRRFRKTSVVILCHHCFLDLLKSLYCFSYGYSLMTSLPSPYCDLIGSAYVFIVTTSAYNMLALVVNQEYQIAFNNTKNEDCGCALFGVFMIWFMSFLLNLGVSIIPSNTSFNADIGICLFLYGHNYTYIVHVMWIGLVTIALTFSMLFFCRMKQNIQNDMKCFKWKIIHQSLTADFENMLDFNIQDYDITFKKSTMHSNLRSTLVLLLLVISFVIFWYPLFILTLFDFHFKTDPTVYRILTIIALSHPITTPLACSFVLRDIQFKGYTLRDISSNILPLRRISSKRTHYENRNAYGFDREFVDVHPGIEENNDDEKVEAMEELICKVTSSV